jgi:uncharacterized membrane protein
LIAFFSDALVSQVLSELVLQLTDQLSGLPKVEQRHQPWLQQQVMMVVWMVLLVVVVLQRSRIQTPISSPGLNIY